MSDPFAEEIVALLPSLRRLALSLCLRGDLANDLVQTAVERAFRAPGAQIENSRSGRRLRRGELPNPGDHRAGYMALRFARATWRRCATGRRSACPG